ncbi:hypothetical protein RND71_043022 [Anisodus tanguticus]|uniref:ORM1-like protein 3 n=1 Tax=Anisodus tanguticus TaxID=243964 RepID=A0AAE1QS12_9SOLA|nr:hypothetical protein RND71_043022 [Anisodus tanguticus]
MANLYVRAVPPTDLNRNTEWFTYPGVWTTLHRDAFATVVLIKCRVHILEGIMLLGYLIASHTTDYQHPMLFFNTIAVFVLVVAKFPNMHKVRIFGINADQ